MATLKCKNVSFLFFSGFSGTMTFFFTMATTMTCMAQYMSSYDVWEYPSRTSPEASSAQPVGFRIKAKVHPAESRAGQSGQCVGGWGMCCYLWLGPARMHPPTLHLPPSQDDVGTGKGKSVGIVSDTVSPVGMRGEERRWWSPRCSTNQAD